MLRPEARLLLTLARLDLEPGDRASALALFGRDLDWTYLFYMAARHGLSPLFYRHLVALGQAAAVPKATYAALWARNEATSRRNRASVVELTRLLGVLETSGIAAIPYKGPTLALSVYRDVALREFGDLDILLRRRDVLRAKMLLHSLGYMPQHSLNPDLESALVRSRRVYELPLVHPADGRIVELHWRTDPDYAVVDLDDDHWWTGLPRIDLGGERVRALETSELLLILCLHGTKHFWGSLGWLVDVAEMIRGHPRIDWKWIVTTSRRIACERRLALGLRLANDLLGVRLPIEVSGMTEDPVVREIAARIRETSFSPEFTSPGVLQAFRLNLRLHENLRHRLQYFASALLNPGVGEWTRWTLPRALFFLYFPLRFARLARRYLLKPSKA